MTDPAKHTKRRSHRIPPEVYDPAKERAAREGDTVTAVIIRALIRYGKGKK